MRPQAPPSLLQVCLATGRRKAFENAVSYFTASPSAARRARIALRIRRGRSAALIAALPLLYRTYHGCAMPLPTQAASIAAWNDDAHAAANRRRTYQQKFARRCCRYSHRSWMLRARRAAFTSGRTSAATMKRFARSSSTRQQNVTRPAGSSYLGRAGRARQSRLRSRAHITRAGRRHLCGSRRTYSRVHQIACLKSI